MIDFHSHFLQDMDDGSKSIAESLQMLELSFNLGVDTIVSTPHFYAYYESIENFLGKRDERLDKLSYAIGNAVKTPQIVSGAEVAFYPGMCADKEILRLCIGKTRCLLIEMPYSEWSSLDKKELLNLMLNRGITPIFAHIERYFGFKQNAKMIGELLDSCAIAQINGGSFLSDAQKKNAFKLVRERENVLLGSDCHNMDNRKPNLDKAMRAIKETNGQTYMDRIERFGREILGQSDKNQY